MEAPPPSRYQTLRVLSGIVLAVVGLLLIWGAVALRGEDPTSINDPISDVLGATAGTLLIVAILELVPLPRRRPDDGHRRLTIAAVSIGAASLATFILFVVWYLGKNIGGDHSVPTMGRLVPPILGLVALCLGLWGLLRSRGDAFKIRGSFAAIVMALCSAIVPIWLWTAHCDLFRSGCH